MLLGVSVPGEKPLPRYGLAGSFAGERLRAGEGWDVCTIVHRPAGVGGELSVQVMRRTTSRRARGAPRVAVSAELARESAAMALVLDNPSAAADMFAAATEVAGEKHAWRAREITVDGEVVVGYEREFGGRWLAYHLTPVLIVSVVAPVELRPDTVELRTLPPDELAHMDTAFLSDLECDLLEVCAAAPQTGETTTILHGQLVGEGHDRAAVESTLRGLLAQGLMARSSGARAGTRHPSGARLIDAGDKNDRWVLTDEGRAAIGLPHAAAHKGQ
jgi:hypothetical protein